MNKKEKDNVIDSLENNQSLYNKFLKWLDKQELDIEFVLYEDEPRYFNKLWYGFLRGLK